MSNWLLVGVDRGIGRAMAEQVAGRGDHVWAACFGDGKDLVATANVTVVPNIDVTSDEAVARLAGALREKGVTLDVVVHVAGVLGVDELGKIDFADVRRQFEINAVGPLRTIQAILDNLAPNARVGIITSRVGSLNDNSSGGMYAYRVSKCAANMVGLNLFHDLGKRGVAVLMLHPGIVDTDLLKGLPRGNMQYLQPGEAASGLIRNMDRLTLQNAGKFQHSNGEYLPW